MKRWLVSSSVSSAALSSSVTDRRVPTTTMRSIEVVPGGSPTSTPSPTAFACSKSTVHSDPAGTFSVAASTTSSSPSAIGEIGSSRGTGPPVTVIGGWPVGNTRTTN